MDLTHVDGMNLGYVRDLLDQYLADPGSVPEEWRAIFEQVPDGIVAEHPVVRRLREVHPELFTAGEQVASAALEPAPPAAPEVSQELLAGVAAAMALVKAHRMHGHLAARLDPLGSRPPDDPALHPEYLGLSDEAMALVPASALRVYVEGDTLLDILPELRRTYCGTIAYEIEHLSSHEQRVWLREAIESHAYWVAATPEEQRHLLIRMLRIEGFEQYVKRTYLGAKSFSIEGLDVMILMLDEAIALAAREGIGDVTMGMAHRGRLNVLAHVLRHCPDRSVIDEVVAAGWSSVLFDASDRDLEDAVRETTEVVAQAHAAGVDVESEIENILGQIFSGR